VISDGLAAIDCDPDLIVVNPPYMADAAGRAYRDGGGEDGAGLSLRFLEESVERLVPGGTLVLYTGSAIVDGEDRFHGQALRLLRKRCPNWKVEYAEIDPDVFGEELSAEQYSHVDRIAAVGLVARRPFPTL
jgi:methylase of polypeptide subunit release factors